MPSMGLIGIGIRFKSKERRLRSFLGSAGWNDLNDLPVGQVTPRFNNGGFK